VHRLGVGQPYFAQLSFFGVICSVTSSFPVLQVLLTLACWRGSEGFSSFTCPLFLDQDHSLGAPASPAVRDHDAIDLLDALVGKLDLGQLGAATFVAVLREHFLIGLFLEIECDSQAARIQGRCTACAQCEGAYRDSRQKGGRDYLDLGAEQRGARRRSDSLLIALGLSNCSGRCRAPQTGAARQSERPLHLRLHALACLTIPLVFLRKVSSLSLPRSWASEARVLQDRWRQNLGTAAMRSASFAHPVECVLHRQDGGVRNCCALGLGQHLQSRSPTDGAEHLELTAHLRAVCRHRRTDWSRTHRGHHEHPRRLGRAVGT